MRGRARVTVDETLHRVRTVADMVIAARLEQLRRAHKTEKVMCVHG